MHIGKVLLAVTPLQRADFWAPKVRPSDSPKPGRLLPILIELPSQATPGAGAPVSPPPLHISSWAAPAPAPQAPSPTPCPGPLPPALPLSLPCLSPRPRPGGTSPSVAGPALSPGTPPPVLASPIPAVSSLTQSPALLLENPPWELEALPTRPPELPQHLRP